MFVKLKAFFTDKDLLKKIAFVIFALFIFRLVANIPIPEFDQLSLAGLLAQNQILTLFNIFSGGGLVNFSIAMLGVFPYITVSIITQLLTAVIPRLHQLYHEEGEEGRLRVTQWGRLASVPVAFVNAVGLLLYFESQGVLSQLTIPGLLFNAFIITAGSVFVMWIGELVTEFGIGNGISLIVFASIVVSVPGVVSRFLSGFDTALIATYSIYVVAFIVVLLITIAMNEAIRPVPIVHTRSATNYTQSSTPTYIPIKVNPAGVIPIIFGLSVVIFAQTLSAWGQQASNEIVKSISDTASLFLAQPLYFALLVFALVFGFTYFFSTVIFNPEKISKQLQTSGAFMPGVRPGEETIEQLSTILLRIVFFAAVFLGAITAVPFFVQQIGVEGALLAVSGSAMIIVVSVVLDIYKKIAHRIETTIS